MAEGAAEAAASRIDEKRLWQRLMEMARLGATAAGGVNRQALTPEDGEARRLLAGRAAERGYAVATDAIGNLFVRRRGRDDAAAPVVAGSHLDSQPAGGKFDGAYGVIAAFEMLEALDEAGIETLRPVELVSWVNEEGCRFQPVTMGSAVFAGAKKLDEMLGAQDPAGMTLSDALAGYLAATPGLPQRPFGSPIAAYVEPHIEQGPVLEQAGEQLGIVTGVQGLRWFSVEVAGEAAHAGTTPRALRRDAMRTATAVLERLYRATGDTEDAIRFTVGRIEVAPGSLNTVPELARFTIDLRHPEAETLDRIAGEIEAAAREEAGPCRVSVARLADTAPVLFDEGIVATLDDWRTRLGLSGRRMISGAAHDAMQVARVAPAGMIFVPCEKGISHSESENAAPGDLAAGARLLAAAVTDLANRP